MEIEKPKETDELKISCHNIYFITLKDHLFFLH